MEKEQHEHKRAERRSSLNVGLQLIKRVWLRTMPAFTRKSLNYIPLRDILLCHGRASVVGW
jgi:hypothetical protein